MAPNPSEACGLYSGVSINGLLTTGGSIEIVYFFIAVKLRFTVHQEHPPPIFWLRGVLSTLKFYLCFSLVEFKASNVAPSRGGIEFAEFFLRRRAIVDVDGPPFPFYAHHHQQARRRRKCGHFPAAAARETPFSRIL